MFIVNINFLMLVLITGIPFICWYLKHYYSVHTIFITEGTSLLIHETMTLHNHCSELVDYTVEYDS